MKIRVGVDAARSRLGRLEIFDDAGQVGPVDACATADPVAARAAGNPSLDPLRPGGPAPFGWYTLKEVHRVDEASRKDLGEKTVLFEPRTGEARRAESLGRLTLALHGGEPGPDGKLRATSAGVRVWQDTLARIVAAAEAGRGIDMEIYPVPLSFWDWLFFWRRRPSRGYGVTTGTSRYRDDDDDWRTSGSSSSSSSSGSDSFSGKGGQFGGAGASGSWDATRTGAAVATGAAVGAGIAAASDAGSSADDGGSSSDDSGSGSEGSTGY